MSSMTHLNLNINIRTLCKEGGLKQALHILLTTHNPPVHSSTYFQLLQTCIAKKALSEGKQIHSHINHTGFTIATNTILQNTLINMYDKCGSLEDARNVFDCMIEPNVFSWNMIIAAYRRHEFPQEALKLFHQMQRTAVQPDEFTFSTILPVCANVASLKHGLQIHGRVVRCGFRSEVTVTNTLIGLYAKCGNIEKADELFDKMHNADAVSSNAMITGYAQSGILDKALKVFEEMPQPNVVSWTAIISGFAQNGLVEKALEMLKQMQFSGVKPNSATYASILSACAKTRALEQGMEIHKQITETGVLLHIIVWNALIDMYAKCGNIEKARELFDKMLHRNVVSWTAIIAGYTQNGLFEDALETFKQMQSADVNPNSATFSSILTACVKMGALEQGMEIHQKIIEGGFMSDAVIVNSLADLYAKCGNIEKAHELFDKMHDDTVSWNAMITGYAQNGLLDKALRIFKEMPTRNVVSWTAIIAGYSQSGFVEKALEIFKQMPLTGVKPNSATFASILPACATMGALKHGMEIHKKIIESNFLSDVVVVNALIDMYAKCGSILKAHKLFDKMLQRTMVSWNAIISGYAQNGLAEKALEIFKQMQLAGVKPNSATFASILPACSTMGALVNSMEIHQTIMESGFLSDVVVTALIDTYAKCGRIHKALKLFDSMPQRDAASWTAVISGYSQNGLVDKALELFKQMQSDSVNPDSSTFASILPACAKLGALEQGMEIHQKVIEGGFLSDLVVMALIDMYAKTGRILNARKLFDKMSQWDVAAWNAMIVAYAQNGIAENALKTFKQMQLLSVKPDSTTFSSILPACAKLGGLQEAIEIHQIIIKSGFLLDVVVVTALTDMYAKCGYIQKAHKMFDEIPQRDVASWNAMIVGYAQNGLVEKALDIYKQMQLAEVKSDSSTFVSILPPCAKLGALEQGMEIHQKIIENGFLSDMVVTALIDMYAKCGKIQKSRELFGNMHHPGVVSWNAMIAGYAMHGYSKDALKLFESMKHFGTNPDHISFICILFSCSHAGLVDDSCKYFNHMINSYCIMPLMDHYVCMVDLLGRAGYLAEALNFINKVPIKPDVVVWICLLGACRSHKNIGLGEFVATLIFELDPKNAAPYVLLSNINAEAGKWGNAQKIRKLMKDRGIVKKPGCSWIEVRKMVHAFCVGDRSHPQTQEIYSELEKLSWEMTAAGYIPDITPVLNDVEEEEKELLVYHHSEKLAIAFGLLNTSPGTSIRVVKNLRVCDDCHTATKFISKIVSREIVVRDANRFHHFKHGECSCGDYW